MTNIKREELAEFLFTMRSAAGLTRKKLAELIGVQESEITSYERERKWPAESLVDQIRQVVKAEITRKRELGKRSSWVILAR